MAKNMTKKALISSVVSLLLCVSMLLGTTYAWFTDSVTSNNNIIKSGNLDIELEYLDAEGNWQTVDATTNVFMDNALWEPGHTEVVYLKISNKGSLAFDFKLSLNIVEEITSINVYDNELKLSDYIMMGAVNDRETVFADRTTAVDALDADAVTPIKEGYAAEGTLYAVNDIPTGGASEKYLALVVYMPESVGNEANHKTGEAVPTIKLGLNLLATQETYESDAFDENYDANANVTAPPVPVEPMTIDLTVYDVFSAGNPSTDIEDLELNIYSFIAEQYQDAYPVETYKDWTCDFFVSADTPLNDGLILAGNYGDWGWLGFWAPQNNPGETYSNIGLLGTVSYGGESNWTYEGICNEVQIFRCGLIDYKGLNPGVKVTVDLRMTSPDGTQTKTVRSITVTLGQE